MTQATLWKLELSDGRNLGVYSRGASPEIAIANAHYWLRHSDEFVRNYFVGEGITPYISKATPVPNEEIKNRTIKETLWGVVVPA